MILVRVSSESSFRLPFAIRVPTTSATGTEVILWAVITDHQRPVKFNVGGTGLIGAWMALIDPELTLDLPPRMAAGTRIRQPAGGVHDVPHGALMASLLSPVMGYNFKAQPSWPR